MHELKTDVAIIGAGLAGLMTALKLAPKRVAVLTPTKLGTGIASGWAQGGIAASIAEDDHAGAHAADTINVAGGIDDRQAVGLVTSDATAAIEELLDLGVTFDRTSNGKVALTKEAAHSRNRILHCGGDQTGAEIMRALLEAVETAAHIEILEEFSALELSVSTNRVTGIFAKTPLGIVHVCAGATVLATGGIGHLFAKTTNPTAVRGDGLAMAARAGAQIADPEFVQFHPTALDLENDPMPLASEAIRGEGAILVDELGNRFLKNHHPLAELAPRDVVARAVWRKGAEGDQVFLDATKAIGADFQARFPTVYNHCRAANINPAVEPIPVAPAAHYHMGGIRTDLKGRTTLGGLWACGEVASTGMHGANRLASNSLLEAIVFAKIVAKDVLTSSIPRAEDYCVASLSTQSGSLKDRDLTKTKIRDLMTKNVGLVRNQMGLAKTLLLLREYQTSNPIDLELLNFLSVAKFVVAGAYLREESRGSHYRTDHPRQMKIATRTFLNLLHVESLIDDIETQSTQAHLS